jgi:hypothetical protein
MNDHTTPIMDVLRGTLEDVRAMNDPYCYGSNVPGYMPDDMDGYDEPMTFDAAKRALIADMLVDARDTPDETAAENLTHAAEDVNLWSGPDSIDVDDGTTLGRVYWIQQAEPDSVDDYRSTYVLGVDTEIIRDVMLGVGGPTRFVRFVCYGNDDAERTEDYLRELELKRCEFHYSWGANGVTSVVLADDETAAMIDAFGFMVGIE